MRGVPSRNLYSVYGIRHICRRLVALAVVLAGAAAGYGEDRSGRSPGPPSAAVAAP
jgi:hypothetical protein